MFARFIDDDVDASVRANFDALVWARLVTNACYRFTPPFVAVIARGLDVSLAELGIALMIGEFAGLLSPVIGRRIDAVNRLAAMAAGMSMIFLATVSAAVSTHVVWFGASVFVLNAGKVVSDTGLVVWINDRVPYERRGRVIGVVETSWALGLFIGVAAMGLVTALVSWRAGMVLGALAMAVSGAIVVVRLPHHEAHAPAGGRGGGRLPRSSWLVVAAMFFLMGASQCIAITFGPWFEEDFGFGGGAIVAVVVAIGVAELLASSTSARWMDDWGKERSIVRGAVLMAVTAALMSVAAGSAWSAVPAVVVFMLGFEFAIVSVLPLAANMVPGASGAGLGLAVGAGTSGRALFSAVGTWLLDRGGSAGPTLAALVLALGAASLVALYARDSR